jgi:hypothetical protein
MSQNRRVLECAQSYEVGVIPEQDMNNEEILKTFQTRHIMAPLLPEGMVDISESIFSAFARLAEMGFDYGVVCDRGKVVGTVDRRKLESSANLVEVRSCFVNSVSTNLPCDTTSISDLIKILASSPFQLVAHGSEIIGVVSESDLNRHPVYAYFYFLLSGMEQNLFEVIRRIYPKEEHWSGFLDKGACKTAKERRQNAVKEGLELDLIHYLFLPQYVGIISNSEGILRELGFSHLKEWSDFGKRLRKFRNDVMHPVKPLVGGHRNPRTLAEIEEQIRNLTMAIDRLLEVIVKNPKDDLVLA